MKGDFMKSLKAGVGITATVLILNWVLSFMNIGVKQVFGITAATGITSTIGNKVVSILQNLVSFNIESIVYLVISASLIFYAGTFMKRTFKFLPNGRTEWSKLALILLYGTAVFYLILIGLALPPVGTLIGLAVYYAVVAVALGLIQKHMKVKFM